MALPFLSCGHILLLFLIVFPEDLGTDVFFRAVSGGSPAVILNSETTPRILPEGKGLFGIAGLVRGPGRLGPVPQSALDFAAVATGGDTG